MGYKISGYIQRFLNFLISFLLILIFMIAAAYALFVLNDNRRIYSAAGKCAGGYAETKAR